MAGEKCKTRRLIAVSWNARLVQECKVMPDVRGLTEDEKEEVGDGQTEEVSVGD